jgi:hypothetical protein
MKTAYKKLFPLHGFMPSYVDYVFAAFSVRVGLEIDQGESSERLAMNAVRNHMRILKGINGSRVITSAPSEPILAIAAAQALNESEDGYERALITLLENLILTGAVFDRGPVGEFESRLLLLRTRDKATTAGRQTFVKVDQQTGSSVVRAVRLSTFLETLLGDDLCISKDKTQRNIRYALLRDTHEVWINFTHFIHLSIAIDEVTPAMLLEAWSSGFAFQCVSNQKVIDGFMVAYFGKLDQPFDMSNLFVIPWHTHIRSDAAELALSRSLAAPFLATSGDAVRRKPWTVVILMDLATLPPGRQSMGPHCDLSFALAERPTPNQRGANWKGYAQNLEVEGQRYCLSIRGHRYPVLQGLERQFDLLFQRAIGCSHAELMPFVDGMKDAMTFA